MSSQLATSGSAPAPSQEPERKLGALDGAALVVSSVIGVGIFTTPGIVAQMAPDPVAFLGVWLLGGLLSLAGALAYAELAAMHPRAGGEYVYIREAFGPLAGFLSGWTSFVAGFSGAIAAGAVGFAAYLGEFVPAAADTEPLLRIPLAIFAVEISPRALVAVVLIALFSLVHLQGVGPGRVVQNALAVLTVVPLVLLVVLGFGVGETAAPPASGAGVPPSTGPWLLALIPVMFTYSGWNAAAYVAGEIREPERNVPRALAIGTAAVVLLYLLLNLLYLHALAPAEMRGTVAVGAAAAAALFGPPGAALFTPLVLLALASSISAMIVTGPRVYYAMARDGGLPPAFGRLQPNSGVPAVAIVCQAVWSCVLVVSGTFEALLTYTGFAIVLFAGVAVMALFALRRRRAAETRPFSAWGYPLAPAAFVIMSLAMVVQAIRAAPVPSLTGLILIAAGAPVYAWCTRRSGSRSEGRGS